MKEFKDKVAVITGAASGIGRAIAERCAQEGMKVVLAGINEANLAQAEQELKANGTQVLSVQTDVSKLSDIQALAQKTLDKFGEVHLLVNNAGVGAGTSIWESTWADWEWVMGVNLWSVIYGIKVFVPIMLAQNSDGHIVNTSSIAGLISNYPSAPYHVTKHGVVALSENLCHSLAQRKAKIKVSLLCPGFVNTRIPDSQRNRPSELKNDTENPARQAMLQGLRRAVESGMSPVQVADDVFDAIKEEKFYVLTHPDLLPRVQTRMENILQGRNPA